jgi:hypothetical protein
MCVLAEFLRRTELNLGVFAVASGKSLRSLESAHNGSISDGRSRFAWTQGVCRLRGPPRLSEPLCKMIRYSKFGWERTRATTEAYPYLPVMDFKKMDHNQLPGARPSDLARPPNALYIVLLINIIAFVLFSYLDWRFELARIGGVSKIYFGYVFIVFVIVFFNIRMITTWREYVRDTLPQIGGGDGYKSRQLRFMAKSVATATSVMVYFYIGLSVYSTFYPDAFVRSSIHWLVRAASAG